MSPAPRVVSPGERAYLVHLRETYNRAHSRTHPVTGWQDLPATDRAAWEATGATLYGDGWLAGAASRNDMARTLADTNDDLVDARATIADLRDELDAVREDRQAAQLRAEDAVHLLRVLLHEATRAATHGSPRLLDAINRTQTWLIDGMPILPRRIPDDQDQDQDQAGAGDRS